MYLDFVSLPPYNFPMTKSPFRLEDRVALITGAGSGIGEAMARLFAQNGARVAVADRDPKNGRRVAREIGARALFVSLDVTQESSVRRGIAAAAKKFGRLDILVNNAGIGLVGNATETSLEDFERLMSVNVRGVFLCSKHAVTQMLTQEPIGEWRGNIINIGSVAGLVALDRRFAYSASKGAVIAMTRCLAMDYVAQKIRANCICPGTVQTPFVEAYLQKFHAHEIEATRAKLNARQPMGRLGRPDEIAALALYLASEASSFITGSAQLIDGGLTAR